MNEKDYKLDSILDNFFVQSKQRERDNFWNNREPKQRISTQERDTVNVLTSFIPAVNSAPSTKQAAKRQHRSRKSTVTARV
ncbi:hypothetical protein FE394_18865 [Xenorhabdus sp. Reich]|uniref:Uncharacterized protein n=1 Tax=Xenorhabdus littoralis TaxID=2582835 RepID=A0ABU4SRA4_9GAMM|nr:hypothetical protein [Xenorhabdus sp. Reich]MDX8001182.1 hypothetical protein [Xenorhabdus sp. Reich]